MQRLVPLLAAFVVSFAAGCGDGPRKDYGDRLSATALELNQALIDLGTTVSQNADAKAIGRRLDKQIVTVERSVGELRALDPPEGAGDAHAKLVSGVEDYLATMRRASDIAKTGELTDLVGALRAITDGNGPGARKIREASEELDAEGFRVSK